MRIPTPDGKDTIEVPDLDSSRPANEVERDAVCFFLETNALSLEAQGAADAVLIAAYLRLILARVRRGEHIARVAAARDAYASEKC